MKLYNKILLGILIAFTVIQFIQPGRNASGQVLPADITKTVNVPDSVLNIFKTSCYDCHSDNTRYPWYVRIQPMGWMMARHIRNGKENLNFSAFGTYSKRKQGNKLRAIETSMKESSMPLSSYTMMHTNARLSPETKKLIIEWASIAKDSLSKK